MKVNHAYTIIEEDGKLYAVRTMYVAGQGQEMFQRLETPASAPRRWWWGTKLAADHKAAEIAALRASLAAFRATQEQERRNHDPS